MILLHTTIDGDRGSFREHAAWKWIDDHDTEIGAQGWEVYHLVIRKGVGHEYDYDKVIRSFWGKKDDLLIFERDMVPRSFQQLLDLVNCPEPSCSIDYPLTRCYLIDAQTKDGSDLSQFRITDREGRLRSNHLLVCVVHQEVMSMMRNKDPENPGEKAEWNPGNWTHCDVPPLGLTRIRKETMWDIPPLWPKTHWLDVDQMVGNALYLHKIRTHIHYPMARHMRRFRPRECVFVSTLPREHPIIPLHEVKPEFQWRIRQKYEATRTHTAFPKVLL